MTPLFEFRGGKNKTPGPVAGRVEAVQKTHIPLSWPSSTPGARRRRRLGCSTKTAAAGRPACRGARIPAPIETATQQRRQDGPHLTPAGARARLGRSWVRRHARASSHGRGGLVTVRATATRENAPFPTYTTRRNQALRSRVLSFRFATIETFVIGSATGSTSLYEKPFAATAAARHREVVRRSRRDRRQKRTGAIRRARPRDAPEVW